MRRTLLLLCPNGDWRNDEVEYYVRPDAPPELQEREGIFDHVTNGMVCALAAAQPRIYNWSKWTGSDLAIDHLGIFEAVHKLLSATFARYCADYHTGTKDANFLRMGEVLRKYGHETDIAAIPFGDDGEVDGEDGGEAASADAGEAAPAPEDPQ